MTRDPAFAAERVSLAELDELARRNQRVVLLDVRSVKAYRDSTVQAAGAVRVPPDQAVETISNLGLPHDTWLVSYCT